MAAFYGNWVRSMQDMQLRGDGDLPSYVPRAPESGDKAPAWAAIAVRRGRGRGRHGGREEREGGKLSAPSRDAHT